MAIRELKDLAKVCAFWGLLLAGEIVYVTNRDKRESDITPQGLGNLENRIDNLHLSGANNIALIMTGKDADSGTRKGIKEAYETLAQNGFETNKIFVLDNSGKPNKAYPVDGPASKQAINYVLDKFTDKISPKDTLVVYYYGHGSKTNGLSTLRLPGEDINQKEFCDKIEKINSKRGLLFVDACYSGGFVEQMSQSQKYVAISSTQSDKPGYDLPGAHFLLHFNRALKKKSKENPGIQKLYEGMLRETFPSMMVDNKSNWTNFPAKISNTNANWSIGAQK